jgi:Protein of unknown function (DUF3349)
LAQLSVPSFLSAVVDWLRAGYPQGIPEQDYVPLLALLARRLSAEEVAAVAAQLQDEGRLPVTDTAIGELIMGITDELPRNEDVARVRTQLAAGGWPLGDPHSASESPDNL